MKKLFVLFLLISCGTKPQDENKSIEKIKNYIPDRTYSVEIVKVKDCDYVFWNKGYGSDMEHYAACSNPLHSCK